MHVYVLLGWDDQLSGSDVGTVPRLHDRTELVCGILCVYLYLSVIRLYTYVFSKQAYSQTYRSQI